MSISRPGFILAGHGVTRDFVNRTIEEVHIGFEDFKATIEWLEELKFHFLNMGELFAHLADGFAFSRPSIHLTFDDGYANNLELIYPFLKSKNIPFSVFISTYHMESQNYFPTFFTRCAREFGVDLASAIVKSERDQTPSSADSFEVEQKIMYVNSEFYEMQLERIKQKFSNDHWGKIAEFRNDRPMNIDEIKTLAKDPLVHIGSHSHHHLLFTDNQEPKLLAQEIQKSFDRLESVIGKLDVKTFCYPNGTLSNTGLKAAQSSNVDLGFGSWTGFLDSNAPKICLPRFWLSNRSRVEMMTLLSNLGNSALRILGRSRPKVLDAIE